jgi:hypothetical protein
VTEGQYQEDIARWGSQTEGLNPERKQAIPVGQLALDERSGDLIAKLTQGEPKVSALVAYEPTQDSEVLANAVENDRLGFWDPDLYICVPKSGEILLGM